jgi:hypothetical protein
MTEAEQAEKEQAVPLFKKLEFVAEDIQLKELVENFDKRLTAIEEQLLQLLNHRHSSSGVIIIFDEKKQQKGGE